MGKSRKILNLIALTVFMGSNLLTPISYAVDDLYTWSETDSSMETQDNESGENVLWERGNGESEGIYSGWWEKNPQIAEQFLDLPISGVAKETPINVQNDEWETQNDEQNTDLADMSKMWADENTPIDILTLELEKSEQPQLQDVSTVIDYYPDSDVRYTLNGNENFTAWTITITDWTDTITILDRNLWATAAGTWCYYKTNWNKYCPYEEVYWYHFQWWNNYWFKPWCDLSWSTNSCSDSITSNAVSWQVDATTISYNPTNQEYYNSWVFYKGNHNWLNDNYKVNLWWWSTGDLTTFVELTEEQAKLRQGPCPKWFHVPSVWEFVKLSSMMTWSSDSEKDVQLHNLLYIPYAGFRDHGDAYVYDMWYYTYLWSSSPSSSNNNISWNYNILDPSLINYYISRGSRADAYSIRCFYDKYETYEAPEVDTIHPAKPEIGCPDYDEVLQCVSHNWFCPQYDFDDDWVVDDYDIALLVDWICTSDSSFINENKDLTNNENPKLMRKTPGGVEWVEEIWWYEIQICSDSGCNNVIHSWSHEDAVWHTDLSDGMYYRRVKAIDIAWNEWEWSDIWLFTVHTTPPEKPEIRCPSEDEVTRGVMFENTPQYDFNEDWEVDIFDLGSSEEWVCITNNTFINEDEDITNSKNPRLMRTIPGEEWAIQVSWYEIQICRDSGCNNVLYSWSYEEIIQNELSDGTYYWRVKAIDIFWNRWEWSDIFSFTVDTIAPAKPEIRCPSEDELFDSMMFENTPQYDFNGDWTVDIDDLDISLDWVCTTDNRYINEDQDITKNKNPRLVWTIPGEEWAIQVSWYEIQICRDSGCNNVLYSWSYEEIIQNELSDGTYYWRVKAIDKAWNEWEWSNIFSFTVDTIAPAKPEMWVPTTGEIYNCILDDQYCPQYDFDKNWRVTTADLNMFQSWVLLSDNTFIKENEDITNSKNPRLVRKTPGGSEWGSEIWWYEIQICRDSGCNNVIHSWSYEDVVWHTNLDDGIYYWRVKAIDKAWNEWEWSDIFSFTVDQPKYTVSYVDWVSWSVFVPQITTGLLSWQVTPDFNGSTWRVNYIFVWWNPIVNPVVTWDVTYTAQWYKDFNGNGENDETEDHFILTIHYVNSKWATVYPDYTWSYVSWASYSVVSTAKEHYTIDKATVSWVMWNENFTEIVTYSTQTPDTNDNWIADEDETHFTLEFTWWENWTLSGQTIWPDVLTWLTFDEAWITIPEIIPNSGYMFSGWDPEITWWTVITSWITLTPVYWDDKNGNGENDEGEEHFTLEFTWWENWTLSGQTIWPDVLTWITFGEAWIIIPEITPNSGYIFGWWSPKTPTSWDVVSKNYSVIWKVDANNNWIADEDEPKSSWSSGWWWGGWGKISNDSEKSAEWQKWNKEDSSADKPDSEWQEILRHSNNYPTELDSSFTKEQKEAYEFAKENWITTMPTIQKADMSWRLTRIQMAKMLSQYAINVLWKTPDTSKTIKFKDVTPKNDADYDNGVTLAYQLWIMWQNMKNNKFRPDDEVTRAEFATALSRLLFNTSDWEYKSTSSYYVPHIKKLMQKWIITKDDPKMKERRWYVMIMLMRSVK